MDPTQIHFPRPVTKHAAHRKPVIFSCSNPEKAVVVRNFWQTASTNAACHVQKFLAGKTRCQAGAISCWAMARCRRLEASAQHPSAQHRRPSCQWFWLPRRPRQILKRSNKNCVVKETMPVYLYHHEDKAAWRTWPHGKPKQDCAKSLGLR